MFLRYVHSLRYMPLDDIIRYAMLSRYYILFRHGFDHAA